MSQIDVPLLRGVSDRRDEPTNGGYSHWLCFLVCRHSSFTRLGLLCRGSISGSDPIFHRFIRPNCSAPPMRVGLVQTQAGCLPGSQAAMLILWAPGGFRVTCYYYRGAYYKAFWADPPSCTVGEPRKTYLGERSFPLILQNVHRYFLYLALCFSCFWRGTCGTRSGSTAGLASALALSSC